MRCLIEIRLLLHHLGGLDDVGRLYVTGRIDRRWNAIWRRLKYEVRSLVGCLRLPCAYLPLVADHGLVCTVLIRDKLPFIAWWPNHRVVGLAVVLMRQARDERLLAQVEGQLAMVSICLIMVEGRSDVGLD